MNNASSLYREKARQAAVGQVSHDAALRVMNPRYWVLGSVLALLCFGAVVFSFFFTLPVTVQGKGIVLSAAGVSDIVASSSGQITQILPQASDTIEINSPIAKLAQPELELELANHEAALADANRSLEELIAFQSREANSLDTILNQRLQSLHQRIATLESRASALRQRRDRFTELGTKGSISREQILVVESDYIAATSQLDDARDLLVQLTAERDTRRISAEAQLLEQQLARDAAARKVAMVADQLERLQWIKAPFGGRIVEIKANIGQFAQHGTPVLSVERDPDAAPIVVAYVSGFEAKNIHAGMPAEVSPATGSREDRGFLKARVLRVADTPASSIGMMRRLQNDRLLESFMQQIDTPFEVEIALETDSEGDLIWSSTPKGDSQDIVENGTLADVRFTLAEMPLAAFAVPALRGLKIDHSAPAE